MHSWEDFGSGKKPVVSNDWLVRSLVTTEKRQKKDGHPSNRQPVLLMAENGHRRKE